MKANESEQMKSLSLNFQNIKKLRIAVALADIFEKISWKRHTYFSKGNGFMILTLQIFRLGFRETICSGGEGLLLRFLLIFSFSSIDFLKISLRLKTEAVFSQ